MRRTGMKSVTWCPRFWGSRESGLDVAGRHDGLAGMSGIRRTERRSAGGSLVLGGGEGWSGGSGAGK